MFDVAIVGAVLEHLSDPDYGIGLCLEADGGGYGPNHAAAPDG
ncbi:hypothetical protein BH20ACI3_BH20ACI3_18540 [soil metagenome]